MEILPENAETVFYGIENTNGLIYGRAIEGDFFMKFNWHNNNTGSEYTTGTNLIGSYNLENALAAITIGCYFNVPEKSINEAVSQYKPSNNRSQYLKTENNEILLDAYNANPSSMQKALENFRNVTGNKKVLILGGMKELGEDSHKEHLILIKTIKTIDAVKIFLTGPEFTPHMGLIPKAVHFDDVDELNEHLKKHPLKGYKILVKGSRSNQLEKVINSL